MSRMLHSMPHANHQTLGLDSQMMYHTTPSGIFSNSHDRETFTHRTDPPPLPTILANPLVDSQDHNESRMASLAQCISRCCATNVAH